MLLTSGINIKTKRTRIDQDFDLYCLAPRKEVFFSKEDRKKISKILINLSDRLKDALSIMYNSSGKLFLLFEKNSFTESEFKNYISNYMIINGQIRIEKVDCKNQNEIYDNDLCQLFCNFLPKFETGNSYNNLTGKLLRENNNSVRKDGSCITEYKITIECLRYRGIDYNIRVSGESYYRLSIVKEYTATKDLNKIMALPKYYYADDCFLLRTYDSTIKDENIYIKKSPWKTKNKNIANDIEIESYTKFINSKKGILYSFLKDFHEAFFEYIEIQLKEIDEEKEFKTYKSSQNSMNIEKINQFGITLVDCVNDSLSEKMINEIEKVLIKKGISNFDGESGLKIILVHNKEYYKNGLIDLYDSNINTQHITYETLINKNNEIEIDEHVLTTILKELLIKKDLVENHISLYLWNCENIMKFGTELSQSEIQTNEKKQKEKRYMEMTVMPNGDFEIKIIEKGDAGYEAYNNFFGNRDGEYSYNVKPEMIISYKGVQFKIYDTGKVVLPNLNEISERLRNYSPKKELSKEQLVKLLDEYKNENLNDAKEAEKIIKQINSTKKEKYQYQEITNSKNSSKEMFVAPLVNLRTPFAKQFVKFCREKHAIILNPVLRSDEMKLYQQIHSLKVENDPHSIIYYVGKKNSVKQVVDKALHIRKITVVNKTAEEMHETLDLILQQLVVDFVRLGDFTVLPFAKKYMNEYSKGYRFVNNDLKVKK